MSHLPRTLIILLVFTISSLVAGMSSAAPPKAIDDTVSTQLNTSTLINVLSNDQFDAPLVTGTVNILRPYRKGIIALRDGQVRFTPKTDFIGDETFIYTVRDDLGSISNPATVTVTVNGKPTDIALSANSLAENKPTGTAVGILTTTDPNPADTHTYTLVTGAGSTDNTSFQIVGNSLQTAAVLDFETQSSYSIRIRSTDSGAGNLFFEKVFTITVTDLNEAPVFIAGPNQIVNEDSGAQTVNPWATGIKDGDAGNQALTFSITNNTNTALFSALPAISPTGSLTYTPAANANGAATISVQLTDNGSNVPPNVNQSAVQTFTITINAVNDAPSFIAINPPTTNEDSGAQSVPGWASFSPGPSDEIGQAVQSYNVSNVSNPGLFTVLPSIATNGTLSYTPASNANGSSTFTVTVTDNGGTANGGLNTSSPQTFTITVNSVNDAPVAQSKSFTAHTNMKIGLTGLLDGVTDADSGINGCSPTFSVAGIANQTGGTFAVTNAGIGAFDFDPNPGFTGNATATFTVQDNGCPGVATSNAANITITVSGPRIWFVNSAASGSNDGRLSNPFTSLASVDNVDTTSDRIFVFSGTYPTGLLTLFDGEQLIGQGVSGTDFDTLFGITPPSGTIARPSINGTRPTLQDTVTLANNNVVRGLNISTTGKSALADIGATIINATVNEVIASSNSTTVNLSDITSGNIALDSTTSTGGTNNVNLSNVSSIVNLGGGALSGASGTSFNVATGIGSISYSGTITQSTNGQRPVLINGKTGGSVTFGGTITANSGSTTGISLTSNTGSSVTFQGGMSLSTGTNTAFSATGGGTVNVCDENPCNPAATGALANTLTTSTGTALNVDNTTIGSNRLEFRSISSNGAANGIVLNTTGSSGGLKVSGTGSAGSGGTVRNGTIGISLNSTQDTSIAWMQLNDFSDFAIRGTTVTNFTLDNSVINGVNGDNPAVDEASVAFNDLTGSATVSNSNISGGIEDNFRIRNFTAGTSLNRITFSNDTFGPNHGSAGNCAAATGDDGLKLEGQSNAVINVTVQNSFFTSARGDLFNYILNGTNTGDLVFTGNTLSNSHPCIATGGGGVTIVSGINVSPGATLTSNISNNTFRDADGHAILFVKSTDPGTVKGTFSSNQIGVAATANSGSKSGSGTKIQNAGLGTITVSVANSQIRQYNNFGIELLTGGGATAMSGNLNATINGNTVSNPGTGGLPMNGVHLNGGTVPGDTYQICTDIGGTLANALSGSGANVGTDFRLRQRQSTTVRLPGYGGANNDNTAVVTFISGINTTSPTGLASNTVGTGGGGFVNGAVCPTP